jgi:hypothetical protein
MARTPDHILTTKPAAWTDEMWAEYQREKPAPTPQGDSFDPTSSPITLDGSLTGPQSLSERAGVERDATFNVTAGGEAAANAFTDQRNREMMGHEQSDERDSKSATNRQQDLEAQIRYDKQQEAARLEQELKDNGLPQRAVPSPRSIDGTPTTQGERFTSTKDATGYQTRPARPDGTLTQSPKDIDMAARGFYPVSDPQGNVSYQRGTGATSVGDDSGLPRGAPGRAGLRPDLTMPNGGQPGLPGQPQKAAKYYEDTRSGPLGDQVVLRPTDAFRAQVAAREEERQIGRQAQASGQTRAQIRGLDAVGRREAVADAKDADLAARTLRYKNQMMLAGRNPQKNLVNAVGMLTPGMRDVVMANLATGGGQYAVDGATPNDVQALNAQAAMRLANNRQFNGQDADPQLLTPMQQQAMGAAALKARDDLILRGNGRLNAPLSPALHASVMADLRVLFPASADALMNSIPILPSTPQPGSRPGASASDASANGGSFN